jgi:hypothetical protein
MQKTLLKKFTVENTKAAAAQKLQEGEELLTDLVQEMKTCMQEIANDLLQPRPEAVERLLKKVHH